MKKNILFISAILLLSLTGCNPSSSESNSSSEELISSDTRTAKEKVLDVCNVIIENTKDQTLFASTQSINGKVTMNNFDSTSGISTQDEITLSNLVVKTMSEIDKENDEASLLYTLKGDYKLVHIEESIDQNDLTNNNFIEQDTLDEKLMMVGEDLYLDLSSFFNGYFTSEQLEKSSDLKLKQIGFSSIVSILTPRTKRRCVLIPYGVQVKSVQ